MLIALPRKLTGMRTLEQEISPTVVKKWLQNMTNRSVGSSGIDERTRLGSGGSNAPLSRRTREVVLPRFKLEQNYDLIENLKEMGLTDLFKQTGDFSGMTSEKVLINWVRRPPWAEAKVLCVHYDHAGPAF